MSQPKVSVIIPVYNCAEFLPQCLDSVLSQTLRELEVLCVDDGSTDESGDVLHSYAQKDPRVTVFSEPNRGGGAARNLALAHACGEYLSFLDGDDFFSPQMLEKAYRAAKTQAADVVVFGVTRYDNVTGRYLDTPEGLRREFLPANDPFCWQDMPDTLFNAFQSWPLNKLFRTAFVQQHGLRFQPLRRTNDLLFVFSALTLAQRITAVREPLGYYRVGLSASCQSTNDVSPLDFLEALLAFGEFLHREGRYETLCTSYLNAAAESIAYNLRSVHSYAAFSGIFEAVSQRFLPFVAFDTLPETLFRDKNAYALLCEAAHATAPEYLFSLYRASYGLDGAGQSPELQAVYASASFRIGRAITALPRRLRDLFRPQR